MEECFFFKRSKFSLFGCLHQPEKITERQNIGIVICSPFAEEKLWSQRAMVNLARFLCENGFPVFRFDYMGHGDSEGNFEDSDISTQVEDIGCAVDELRSRSRVSKVGLLGLRLGATLAILFAEKTNIPDFLVLWEPIVRADTYLIQILRSSLATQMRAYKKITYPREQMIRDLESGKAVMIDGYSISPKFYRQALSLKLDQEKLTYSKPIFITHISKVGKRQVPTNLSRLYQAYRKINPAIKFTTVEEKPFWNDVKVYFQRSENLFRSTLAWLMEVKELC